MVIREGQHMDESADVDESTRGIMDRVGGELDVVSQPRSGAQNKRLTKALGVHSKQGGGS